MINYSENNIQNCSISFLGKGPRSLIKTGLPLTKNEIMLLAKSVLIE